MSSTLTAMKTIKGVNLGAEFATAAADIKLAERAIDSLDDEMAKFAKSARAPADGFTFMKGVAVNAFRDIAMAAKNAVGDVIVLVDQTTTQAARLSMVNDGLQTQAQLQESIFQAAQRSRSEYGLMMDSVAKLNLLAGDAFSTNKEAVAYAELLSKSFKIAGTDTMAQVGATRQLIQALGSGALRGDELNSIFEAAPNLIRNIADYLEVPIGQIRDLAGDGELTADIIKAAMFSAADDINSKFAQMPMTIGEIGTVTGNVLLKAFTPALQAIGEGARYIYENWDGIAPVFVGVSAGILGAATAWGIYSVAQLFATGAAQAFFITLLTNPITYIAIAIGVLIGLLYNWAQSVGGVEIAWMIAMDRILLGWDMIKLGFFTGVFWVLDMNDKMALGILKVGVSIANYMGDMKVNVLTILQSMVNGAIGIINDFISAINAIPGVSIEPIAQATFAATAASENEAKKQARNQTVAGVESIYAASAAERSAGLAQMKYDAAVATAERQANISVRQAEKQAEATTGGMDMSQFATSSSGGGKALKTAEQNKLITDEDIKLLADVATRDYQLNYRQITPNVTFGDMYINENMDADGVIERFASAMEEMASSDLVVA